MKKTLSTITIAACLALAAYSNIAPKNEQRPTISQNPLPACPPFCDEPSGGPDTTARR